MTIELARAGPRVSPSARMAVVIAGVVWALVAEWIRLANGWSLVWVLGDLVPGLVFLVCGYLAWARNSGDRIGSLMVAIGFAWYAGTAAASGVHAVDRAASALQGYYDGLLAWLILAYPTGHLGRRSSRLAITAFMAVLGARTIVRLLVFPWTGDLDVSDPSAVDRYVAEVIFRDGADTVFRGAIAVFAIAILLLALRRWQAETATGRAIAAPLLLGGLGFGLGILVETLAVLGASGFDDRSLAWNVAQWSTVVTASLIPAAFLFGLGQDRLARGRVADLVVGLGRETPGSGDLQSTLREILRDPSLTVLHPDEATGRLADADGNLVDDPDRTGDRAVTRVERGGRLIGALVHDPALVARPDLMRSVAAATGLALENEQLQAELRERLGEIQASRARIVAAGDAERRRVERDLHDGAQQRFVTLALALQMARSRVDADDHDLAESLERAAAELESGLAELREFARGIHPTVLTEDGLAAAIGVLAERSAVPVTADVPDRRFDPAIESAAYFVVAESLTNVAKHAPGASAAVLVTHDGSVMCVEVRDDGPGGARTMPGSGLTGLADRVAAVGGRLTVENAGSSGTIVRAVMPCE